MSYETVVAAYDTPAHAQAAAAALKAGGFAASDISVLDQGRVKEVKEPGFWQRLFGTDLYQHEAAVYGQTVDRGGVVVSVRVPASEVAHASAVLDLHHPIDVRDRALTCALAPAGQVEAIKQKIDRAPLATRQVVAVTPKLAQAHDGVLRLAEEQLEVGKRMVETGRTRVRRFVTEREVTKDLTLHDEHAELVRRAVTDPKYVRDIDWADREIEMIETAEHALVNKTARVVEEVGLKKIGTDHVETIHEKLRRQQVAVEHLGADGKVISEQKPTRI